MLNGCRALCGEWRPGRVNGSRPRLLEHSRDWSIAQFGPEHEAGAEPCWRLAQSPGLGYRSSHLEEDVLQVDRRRLAGTKVHLPVAH